MKAFDRLLLPENLNYAWNKAKRLYSTVDGYTDYGELAEFELNLEERLIKIQSQFKEGVWRLTKLRPLPRPKKIKNNLPIDRQYYHVAIDDQVAWIAVANVLGPELDQCMPPWSYGNRIYRPAWYEQDEDRKSTLEIGPYRHASGHLYRKFQHSWPLFRRHISLTAKTMAGAMPSDLEKLDQADFLAIDMAKKEGLRYFRENFWRPNPKTKHGTRLYHASIDLKYFFPNLRTDAVLRGLSSYKDADERMQNLLASMLMFRLDKSEMPIKTLDHVEPTYDDLQVMGIPTGLFVAGFLANVAMLQVDKIINKQIEEKRSLAHFRFVDDHIILSYDFDELCDWLDFYYRLLRDHKTGAEVNQEKYDPILLRDWMAVRSKNNSAKEMPSEHPANDPQRIKEAAANSAMIDGANPTQLLTKTLGQISALATTNVDVLDDNDLEEHLKMLEWLLLANIPEREIRPDTRAAFAAGRIATLAPILVQETEGLVEASRSLETLKAQAPDSKLSTSSQIAKFNSSVKQKTKILALLEKEQRHREDQQLRHCFDLLLQSFREYPGKPRLFYRIHEYCRVTGYRGLTYIAQWIQETRESGYPVWANYYSGLSLHILARGVLLAARTLVAEDVLRSEQEAALRHLKNVCDIDTEAFFVPQDNATWFHAVSRIEFGVALLSVATIACRSVSNSNLQVRLGRLAKQYIHVSFDDPSDDWERETGYLPGVWAHLTESILSINDQPTASWRQFELLFSSPEIADVVSARRYPRSFPSACWFQLLHSKKPLPKSDSGWLCEVMKDDEERITAALSSKRLTFRRAAKSLCPPHIGWITLVEWTCMLSQELSPFDPRRSEWTALEIVRQLVSPVVSEVGTHQTRLDNLHPNNVLIPNVWKTQFPCNHDRAGMSWEEWRNFVGEQGDVINLRPSATSIVDYRYFTETQGAWHLDEWERRLTGVGRILLDQLRLEHEAPSIWNLRGNEQIFPLPRTLWFRSLAISSATLLLVESCLGARTTETRSISRNPSLFGWDDGREPNDANLDPPLLIGPNELLAAICHAQQALKENQLAVSMNQPRQIIPFRLNDFSAGPNIEEDTDAYG